VRAVGGAGGGAGRDVGSSGGNVVGAGGKFGSGGSGLDGGCPVSCDYAESAVPACNAFPTAQQQVKCTAPLDSAAMAANGCHSMGSYPIGNVPAYCCERSLKGCIGADGGAAGAGGAGSGGSSGSGGSGHGGQPSDGGPINCNRQEDCPPGYECIFGVVPPGMCVPGRDARNTSVPENDSDKWWEAVEAALHDT
jgi:hypothetical protein